ncbi:MAG: sulfatase-like hydrolase/transferase [Candidatus Methanoperedenaceae archaeon]|nr:sulfatase-like hydrolase/transferase [Candidatus Methanoperedenaceae archaeon]
MKKVLIISILLLLLSGAALAVSQITLNEVKRPQSAILFIVDGFGSSYYYPELTPIALDGSELLKARTRNLTFGTRIVDIKTSHPITGIAHSVIATGYSEANEEVVGYTDATIFDVTRKHGFVNIAVMQKGDFKNMREEQDIIIFDENNSINKPSMSIQSKSPPIGVYDSMYEWKMKVPSYMNKSGVDRYSAYNKWGIDTANAVMKFMIKNHPDQKFLLTVNIGAIDSGGHNLGADDYIRLIEDLDRDFYALYKTASENNIALFFTADHGMSFAKKNAQRGGHSGDKYISRQESLRIPLVILSPNAVQGTVSGEYRQEDIAPTLLSILDLPPHLQYADGKAINIKNYASIFIKADSQYTVSLWDNGRKISEGSDSELIFSGLPLNTTYTLKASGTGGTYEEHVSLDSDKQFNFNSPEAKLSNRAILAVVLILIVIIGGIIVIKRIKD